MDWIRLQGDPSIKKNKLTSFDTWSPKKNWHGVGQSDHNNLGNNKGHQWVESLVHKAVRVKPDAKHVGTKPRPSSDYISKDGQARNSPDPGNTGPSGVENDCIPDDNQQSTIFFGIPTPKSTP